jgi:sugar/nucleoside kinase (ribokinase family)
VRHVFVTLGERGVLWARAGRSSAGLSAGSGGTPSGVLEVVYEEHPAIPVPRVVSTRGAGDCFVAGAAWALARAPPPRGAEGATDEADEAVRAAVRAGLRAAHLCVMSEEAVPEQLAAERLLAE